MSSIFMSFESRKYGVRSFSILRVRKLGMSGACTRKMSGGVPADVIAISATWSLLIRYRRVVGSIFSYAAMCSSLNSPALYITVTSFWPACSCGGSAVAVGAGFAAAAAAGVFVGAAGLVGSAGFGASVGFAAGAAAAAAVFVGAAAAAGAAVLVGAAAAGAAGF